MNPDEGIWKHLKYVELKNVCCRNLSELKREELGKAKERLRQGPRYLRLPEATRTLCLDVHAEIGRRISAALG